MLQEKARDERDARIEASKLAADVRACVTREGRKQLLRLPRGIIVTFVFKCHTRKIWVVLL